MEDLPDLTDRILAMLPFRFVSIHEYFMNHGLPGTFLYIPFWTACFHVLSASPLDYWIDLDFEVSCPWASTRNTSSLTEPCNPGLQHVCWAMTARCWAMSDLHSGHGLWLQGNSGRGISYGGVVATMVPVESQLRRNCRVCFIARCQFQQKCQLIFSSLQNLTELLGVPMSCEWISYGPMALFWHRGKLKRERGQACVPSLTWHLSRDSRVFVASKLQDSLKALDRSPERQHRRVSDIQLPAFTQCCGRALSWKFLGYLGVGLVT